MRVSRPDMVAALVALGGKPPLVPRLMRDLEPLFRIAETGEHRLADAVMLNQANVADAVAKAVLESVTGIVPVSASKDSPRADWRREQQYASFVTSALRRNRREAFDDAHGDTLSALVDPLWEHLGMALTLTLQATHGDFLSQLDDAMAADVAYAPIVTVAYAAGYAAVGDEKNFSQMRGLVRLLPWLLPIGTPEGAGGSWLVLVD